MKRLNVLIAVLAAAAAMWAIQPTCVVPLYPNGLPDSNGYAPEDEHVDAYGGIFKTSNPRMDIYLPAHARGTILVCPGGAYIFTSTGNEGINVAEYFVPRGYAIAVLKYRMPNGHEAIPLEDACRAMEIIRDSASAWHLPPEVGVMGFSAGGHLAASLLTMYNSPKARPDYGILVYPVISMDAAITHLETCEELLGKHPTAAQRTHWSTEKQVNAQTPPCLIVACQDDSVVPIENSLRFYQALTAAHVPASIVIVPIGDHGWGFLRQFPQRELIDRAILDFLNR